MTVPIFAVAFVCTAVTGYFCDKIPQWRGLVIAGWLTVSLVTSLIVCTVYNFTVRYAMLVLMAAGLWSSNALSLSFAASTFGSMDAETRAVALATVNGCGNLAQVSLLNFDHLASIANNGRYMVAIFSHLRLRRNI